MMTRERELLQQALDALDAITDDVDGTGLNTMPSFDKAIDAITALREALAEPGPEPAAWKCANCGNTSDCQGVGQGDNWCNSCAVCGQMQPLYAAPPAAPAPAAPVVPLTDEQINEMWRKIRAEDDSWMPLPHEVFARAIERAHGITGGGNG